MITPGHDLNLNPFRTLRERVMSKLNASSFS
jgi:hypothetical protein